MCYILDFDLFLLISGYPREFDPKFHGPIEKRGCTDIFWLFFFILFLIGWIVVAVIGNT